MTSLLANPSCGSLLVGSSRAVSSTTAPTADETGKSVSTLHEGPEETEILPPTASQMRLLAFASLLPYIGFGFLDNFIMIAAGDQIDQTLCVTFSLSTMAAAAIGNTISDVVGIFGGGMVERAALRAGIAAPPLSQEQREMRITKVVQYGAQSVGIVIGCIIGMCPLLWMDTDKTERMKLDRQIDAAFQAIVADLAELLQAEAAIVLMVDEAKGELYTKAAKDVDSKECNVDAMEGIPGAVVQTGRYVNIEDIKKTKYQPLEIYGTSGIDVRSLICVPIFGAHDKVIGVIELVNKKTGTAFDYKDEHLLNAVASHVSATIGGEELAFKQVLSICRQSVTAKGFHQNRFDVQRNKAMIKTLVDELGTVVNCEAVTLMLYDEVNNELFSEATQNLPEMRCPLSEGIMGHVARSGQVQVVHNLQTSQFFDPKRHLNYNGTGIDIRSILAVPIFDSRRSLLGVLEFINKRNNAPFTADDLDLAIEVTSQIALNLEGEGSSLRKAMKLLKQQKSLFGAQRQAMKRATSVAETTDLSRSHVVIRVDSAQCLPKADFFGSIDPYVVINIVHHDPLDPPRDPKANIPKKDASRTTCKRQNKNPRWDETLKVEIPEELAKVPHEELYVHLQLWDRDFLKSDDLIGHVVIPLVRLLHSDSESVEDQGAAAVSYPVQPIRGQEKLYDLSKSRLQVACWLSDEDDDT